MCFFLLGSCAVNKWQNTLIQKGDMNDAINNAITDFVHTSKWSKKDSIFTVTITDINEENINITIAVADDDVYPNSKNKVFFSTIKLKIDKKIKQAIHILNFKLI